MLGRISGTNNEAFNLKASIDLHERTSMYVRTYVYIAVRLAGGYLNGNERVRRQRPYISCNRRRVVPRNSN